MNIRVECYSGYHGEETPRRVWFGNRKVDVMEVVDQWLSPDHRYFKVLGDDESVYIIRHDTITCEWNMTFYKKRELN